MSISEMHIVITRHDGAYEWLLQEHPELRDVPRIKSDAKPEDVKGRIVWGNLPLALGALARQVNAIEFSGKPPRGREYGPDEMRQAGAKVRSYRVFTVSDLERRIERAVAGAEAGGMALMEARSMISPLLD